MDFTLPHCSRSGFWLLSCWCWALGDWSPLAHIPDHSLSWGIGPSSLRIPWWGGVVVDMPLGLREEEGLISGCGCLNLVVEETTERLSCRDPSNLPTGRVTRRPTTRFCFFTLGHHRWSTWQRRSRDSPTSVPLVPWPLGVFEGLESSIVFCFGGMGEAHSLQENVIKLCNHFSLLVAFFLTPCTPPTHSASRHCSLLGGLVFEAIAGLLLFRAEVAEQVPAFPLREPLGRPIGPCLAGASPDKLGGLYPFEGRRPEQELGRIRREEAGSNPRPTLGREIEHPAPPESADWWAGQPPSRRLRSVFFRELEPRLLALSGGSALQEATPSTPSGSHPARAEFLVLWAPVDRFKKGLRPKLMRPSYLAHDLGWLASLVSGTPAFVRGRPRCLPQGCQGPSSHSA